MSRIVGASNRYVVEVDDTNRLLTRSVAQDDSVDAIKRGDGFVIQTGEIILTNDAESAIAIIQNDEDRNIIAIGITINVGDSTGATSDTVELVTYSGLDLEMTGGSGNPPEIFNLIIGNPGTLDNTSEVGQQGATVTGGFDQRSYVKAGRTTENPVVAVFPKGAQAAFAIKPPTGNTSMAVSLQFNLYLDKSS